jgi:glucose/arabinose dehydrogenase
LTRIQRTVVLPVLLGILIIVIILYTSRDSILLHFGQTSGTEAVPKIKPIEVENSQKITMLNKTISNTSSISNDGIIILVDKKKQGRSELPLNLSDPKKSCKTNFKCAISFSTGWNDKRSFMVSTVNSTRLLWTSIVVSQEVGVRTNDRYELLSHIKLNKWVVHTKIILEGFNETTNKWIEISQCPYSTSGPIEWKEFRCSFTIDPKIIKVRVVLKAGWSSESGKEAVTWFDYLNITKFESYVTDPNLKAEVVYEGLEFPTSMAFLGPDDILVLEKNKGSVQRIVNGQLQSISTNNIKIKNMAPEQGMLGVAGLKGLKTYLFVYFTQHNDKQEVYNYLYRYELVNNNVVNPKLLLDLPAGYQHNGGPVLISPDKQSVYLAVGDLENEIYTILPHKALNNKTGAEPDGSGGILRLTLNGEPIKGGILGSKYPLTLYYAYGIRESFGMDFDPITGNLWDTENGHDAGDEINMVEPGFNSGWNKAQGIWPYVKYYIPNSSDATYNPSDLVTFDGKGIYHSPQFTWNRTVGPTALTFMPSDKLGTQYKNDMFVTDVNNGRIYHFELNQTRTGLLLDGPLRDKIADTDKELKNVIFAGGFGLISDLDIGPDGYLYFLVYNEGKLYRIVPIAQDAVGK